MTAWKELLGSDVGLMSLGVIVFMLGMGAFFVRYFVRHVRDDTRRALAQGQGAARPGAGGDRR